MDILPTELQRRCLHNYTYQAWGNGYDIHWSHAAGLGSIPMSSSQMIFTLLLGFICNRRALVFPECRKNPSHVTHEDCKVSARCETSKLEHSKDIRSEKVGLLRNINCSSMIVSRTFCLFLQVPTYV